MKKQLLTLIALTIITITGCSKKDETSSESKFKGSYSGNYSGGDQGGISVDVDAKGNLKGTSISSRTSEIFPITGTVDANGVFKGSTDIGTNFSGTFTQSSVTGTWSNTSLKLTGTWTGTKK